MNRVKPEDSELLFKFLEFSKRLPLDIMATTPYSNGVDAARSGATRFFTGKPCKRGHLSDRHVSSGGCVECSPATRVVAARRDAPPPPPRVCPEIPQCLLVTHVTPAPCMKCSRHFSKECKGIHATNLLRRAQMSYPDFPPIGRADAIRQGATVYMPAEPCKKCGVRIWRSVSNGACAECNLRARNMRRGFTGDADTSGGRGAIIDARIATWIDPEEAARQAEDDARVADMRRRNA